MKHLSVIAAGLAAALSQTPVLADEVADAIRACDVLTSSANDPDRRVEPISFDRIDPMAAIDACDRAIVLAPQDGKLHFQLGRAYEAKGDFAVAWDHYLDGAELGSPISMRGLARLAYLGWGHAADHEFAFMWFQAASDAGLVLATRELAVDLIADTTAIALQDYPRALALLLKAVDQGDIEAIRFVGKVYEHAGPDLRDYAKAEEWYLRSAEGGSANGMNDLAVFYGYAEDRAPEWDKAVLWLERAIEAGSQDAPHNLGLIYYNGLGAPQDYPKAAELFQIAADRGHLMATGNLAYMYDLGQGVPVDPLKAAELVYRVLVRGYQPIYEVLRDDPKAYRPETLKQIEQLLTDAGFHKGTVDGVIDEESRAAFELAYGSAV